MFVINYNEKIRERRIARRVRITYAIMVGGKNNIDCIWILFLNLKVRGKESQCFADLHVNKKFMVDA